MGRRRTEAWLASGVPWPPCLGRTAAEARWWKPQEHEGQEDAPSALHEERLDTVVQLLLGSGARRVLDLGCGSGALLERLLAEPHFTRIVGVDSCQMALGLASQLRGSDPRGDRLSLRHGSFCEVDDDLCGFDAAAIVEAIEHVDPGHLSQVERSVFTRIRPRLVVMTTPNREYNELLGMREGELRHPEHRFEWTRWRFETWALGVGRRNGYGVAFDGIGPASAWLGCPTQAAIFRREEEAEEAHQRG